MAVAYAEATSAALRTSTGTQDFTVTGFGTPVAYIVQISSATADGTKADHARWSFGVGDGTRNRMIASMSKDNVTTAVIYRSASTDHVAGLVKTDGSGWDVLVQFSAFITNGIRLNVSATDGTAYICTVIMVAGADVQAYAGDFDMGTVAANATLDVTSPPFTPDMVLFLSADTSFASGTPTPAANTMVSIGYGIAGSFEQARATYANTNGVTTSIPSFNTPATLANNAVIRVVPSASTPTNNAGIRLTAMLSNGFTVLAPTGGSPMPITGYLALRLGGVTLDVELVQSPTSAGDKTMSMTNPGYALLINTAVSTTGNLSATTASQIGFGFASQNSQRCWSQFERDNVTTMDNGAIVDAKAIRILDHTGADFIRASAAFSTTALTLTYDQVDAGAVHNSYVLLIPRATFSGTGSPSFPLPTGTGAGLLVFEATGAGSFPPPTGTGAGLLTFTGTGAGTFPAPTGTGAGLLVFSGTGAGTFPAPTGTGAGLLVFEGTGAGSFPLPTGTGAGLLTFTGTGAGSFPLPTGTGAGLLEFTSTGAGTFPLPQAAGIGLLVFEGSGAGLFPLPTGTGAALLVFTGTGDGVFPLPTGDGTGTVLGVHVGSGDGVFPLPTGTGAGLLIFTGTGDGFFPLPTGTGAGSFGELEGCTVDLLGSSDQEAVLVGSSDQLATLVGGYDRRSDLRGANC